MEAASAQQNIQPWTAEGFDEWVAGRIEPQLQAAELAARQRAERQHWIDQVAAIDQRMPIAAKLTQRVAALGGSPETARLLDEIQAMTASLTVARTDAIKALGFDPASASADAPTPICAQRTSVAPVASPDPISAQDPGGMAFASESILTAQSAADKLAAAFSAAQSDGVAPEAEQQPHLAPDSQSTVQEADSRSLASADRRARFVGKLRKCRKESECHIIWKELGEGLHKLTLADADASMHELADACQRSFVAMPLAAAQLRAKLDAIIRSSNPAESYAALCEVRRSERVNIAHVHSTISGLHQEAITLETDACKQSAKVTWNTMHYICCRAKLLQRDYGNQLTENQERLLHNEVFGRLSAVTKRHKMAYVPSLKTDWYPADLVAQCDAAHSACMADLARAVLPPAVSPPPPLTSAEIEQREKVDAIALADVYRAVHKFQREQEAEGSVESLRAAALVALQKLGDGKERLPELLFPYSQHFESGSNFRWLRKKFSKLAERRSVTESTEIDQTAADLAGSEEELPVSIPTIDGPVPHPSVAFARDFTKGKRVLLVGGMVDEARRLRLLDALHAESVEWIVTERSGGSVQANNAAERVRQGRFDFVVYLLRFLSHKVTEAFNAAAQEGAVPIVRVPNGLGVVGIAEAVCQLVRRGAS